MNTMMHDFACSVEGANHKKANKVCQDSSASYVDNLMAIAVVADGHGSDNYPRTDKGSRFAIDAAVGAIREFVTVAEKNDIDLTMCSDRERDGYLEQLKKSILAKWYDAVEDHWQKHPFVEEELSKVSEKYKDRYTRGERIEKAYGTTLIAACQTKDYWFGLQIGDGKCVCLSQDGAMSEPIPWDEDCQLNVTTSICDSDAITEFRHSFMKVCPIATLLGTDGIDDSYTNAEELHRFYRGVVGLFVQHGSAIGKKEIAEYLPTLSERGSGDDVSVAGFISASLSPQLVAVLKAKAEYAAAKARKEQAEHDVKHAKEKQEYISSALKQAKLNWELCIQKEQAAKDDVKKASEAREAAIKQLEEAKNAVEQADIEYKNSLSVLSAETVAEVGAEVRTETADVVVAKAVNGKQAFVGQVENDTEAVVVDEATIESPAVNEDGICEDASAESAADMTEDVTETPEQIETAKTPVDKAVADNEPDVDDAVSEEVPDDVSSENTKGNEKIKEDTEKNGVRVTMREREVVIEGIEITEKGADKNSTEDMMHKPNGKPWWKIW